MLKASKTKANDVNVPTEKSLVTNNNHNNNKKDDGQMIKRRRILEKITYDDLQDNDTNPNTTGQQLNLSKVIIKLFIVIVLF